MHHIDQSAADILKAAMKAERAAAEVLERFIAHMPEEPAPGQGPMAMTDTEDAEAAYDALRAELKRTWNQIPVLRPASEEEGNPSELEVAVRAYAQLTETLGMRVERLERRLRPILREDAAAIGHLGGVSKGASPMAQAVQAQNELLLGLIERLQTLEGALDV